jgi:ABC-type transport system substrate-binding protein
VTRHDGSDFTADDVIASIKRIRAVPNSRPRSRHPRLPLPSALPAGDGALRFESAAAARDRARAAGRLSPE